ncbi:MAG: GAF domain-containing protein, partial [Anaerolineae bacterium]|nr:GAF domain-containing protein [Anaerolineae bacterium]
QDTQPAAFDQEAVSVLQVLADQVAVALDNARLLRESQVALEAERRAYGEISARGWARMVHHEQELGYVYRQGGDMAPVQGPWSAEMVRASTQGEIVVGGEPGDGEPGDGKRKRHADSQGGADKVVAVPIKIRDRVIGVVRLQKPEDGLVWTEEELALIQTLTPQLEVALESARLYQDTQQRAARERMIGEATARMRETLDMDAVLRTATQQMRQTLGLHDVTIRLAHADRPDGDVITPGGKEDGGS